MNTWQRWKGIMKCYPFEEKRLAKWQPPYIVQPKYDGVRCRAVPILTGPKGNEYMLLSSEENILFSVPHLNELFSTLGIKCELDGELYCHGMKFEEIVSITSRTVNLHDDHKRIQFHCFDIVNDQPQMRRQLIIENLRGVSPWLVVAPFYLCENLEEVMRAFDTIVNEGYEGIIVRHNMAPYERKRSTWLMKFKPKKEDEYQILSYNEEYDKEGNPKDTLGSLVCLSGEYGRLDITSSTKIYIDDVRMVAAVNGIEYNIFKVGTGFTEERRKELWEAQGLIKGMKAKVKYQHITSGKQVPRFPVFVEVVPNE